MYSERIYIYIFWMLLCICTRNCFVTEAERRDCHFCFCYCSMVMICIFVILDLPFFCYTIADNSSLWVPWILIFASFQVSTSVIWLNKAKQENSSEHQAIISRLYKFYNRNASSVRTILVANCLIPDTPKESSEAPERSENKPQRVPEVCFIVF